MVIWRSARLFWIRLANKNPTDSEGKTPLHAVALIGNDEIYEEIATRADDVNPPDNYGWTPLHSAAKEGHFAICEWILAETDDANPGDNAGRTPLHEAANSCYAKICEIISDELWAEDRNPRDNLGNTPRELWEKASQEFQLKLFGDINDVDEHEPNDSDDSKAEVFYNINYINVNYSVKNSTDCKYLLYFSWVPRRVFEQSAILAFFVLFCF